VLPINTDQHVRGPDVIIAAPVQIVPNWGFTQREDLRSALSIAPAENLRTVEPRERQLTTAAAGDPIAILYGKDRIGPSLVRFLNWGGSLVVLHLWGYGPYDAIERVWINDDGYAPTGPFPAGIALTHYDGTQTTPDATLVAAYAANGKTWTNALTNCVYTVGVFTASESLQSLPLLNARWRGRKLFDPRTGLTVWSDNPALALRDMLTASRINSYGFGRTVTDADITALANHCDAMIGSPAEKRRTINYNFAQRMPAQVMLDTLRTAAGCFVVMDTYPVRIIIDRDEEAWMVGPMGWLRLVDDKSRYIVAEE
jgi:hypothetical protein